MNLGQIISLLFLITLNSALAGVFSTIQKIDDRTNLIHINFNFLDGDFIYKDFLDISCDSPNIQLSEITYSQDAKPYYDPAFKETKKIFKNNLSVAFKATGELSVKDTFLHVTYYQHSKKRCVTELFPLFSQSPLEPPIINTSIAALESNAQTHSTQKSVEEFDTPSFDIQLKIKEIFQNTQILYLILVLILLYILMSLGNRSKFYLIFSGILLLSFKILAAHVFYWFIGFCALCIGLHLLLTSIKKETRHWYLSLAGVLLVAGSLIGFAKAYSTLYVYRKLEMSK